MREHVARETLAEEACQIEIDILKEPIGKQDQYVAAFGGINAYEINQDGKVRVEPLRVSNHTLAELEGNILIFYTGMVRDASKILGRIKKNEESGANPVVEKMHRIKEIGYEVRDTIAAGDIGRFGELLDVHWRTKKNLSNDVSNSRIDDLYEKAKRNGAIGGKVMGAGGGGFLMLYADSGKRRVRDCMTVEGLKELRFRFDYEGSKVSLNL
jgi:D-glycero-alpha-D-manno-heptose-7-phosphate kinase